MGYNKVTGQNKAVFNGGHMLVLKLQEDGCKGLFCAFNGGLKGVSRQFNGVFKKVSKKGIKNSKTGV